MEKLPPGISRDPQNPTTLLVRVDGPRDPNTKKRKRFKKSLVNGKLADAKKLHAQMTLDALKPKESKDSDGLTVADLYDKWLPFIKRKVTQKTFETYEGLANKIVEALGDTSLAALSTELIDAQYVKWEKTGRVKHTKNGPQARGGLAPVTIVHLHKILSQAVEQAVVWDYVGRNVVRKATPPTVEDKLLQTYTFDQLDALLKAAERRPIYRGIIYAAICTIFRRGEVYGLRWSDIDFDHETVRCAQSVVVTQKNGVSIKPPKTKTSRRTIDVDEPAFFDALRQIKVEQAKAKLAFGGLYDPNGYDLVFATADGSPMNPSSLQNALERIQRRAGVPLLRFHDLRHTGATIMAEEGVRTAVIAQRGGWSSTKMVDELYAHLTPRQDQGAAKTFGAAWKRARAQRQA